MCKIIPDVIILGPSEFPKMIQMLEVLERCYWRTEQFSVDLICEQPTISPRPPKSWSFVYRRYVLFKICEQPMKV